MKTDVIAISGGADDTQAVLEQIDKVIAYKGLAARDALSLRLLAEEMTGMMRAITGSMKGEFWAEDQDGAVYELHLKVHSLVDEKMRKQLLDASTSKKNEAARGIMGKIRTFFEPASDVPMFAGTGVPQMSESYSWSMADYREQLRQYREMNANGRQEEWDELEKSVVANVADDVKVSIRGRIVEMIITKKMG